MYQQSLEAKMQSHQQKTSEDIAGTSTVVAPQQQSHSIAGQQTGHGKAIIQLHTLPKLNICG